MTTDNFCFYLQNAQIQTSQTRGQRYSDNSPFSIPCFDWSKYCSSLTTIVKYTKACSGLLRLILGLSVGCLISATGPPSVRPESSLVCLGSALGLPWVCLGSALGLPWVCLGSALCLPCVCLGSAEGLPWVCLGSPLITPIVCLMFE